jgi:hypothetical protein
MKARTADRPIVDMHSKAGKHLQRQKSIEHD